jgi:HTH-type transcriptional regulator / antitoxin HigA
MSLNSDELDSLFAGQSRISVLMGRRLSHILGGTVGFWIARDGQFTEDVARLEAHRAVERLPITDMAAFGWIDKPTDWLEQIEAVLRLFDVTDIDAWRAKDPLAIRGVRLRASESHAPAMGSLAVWLRQVEKQAHKVKCETWDPSKFRSVLESAKALTRLKDPVQFVPNLQQLCATAGVAVVVVRAPSGCTISGAARLLSEGFGIIGLTARHLTSDHLWFTFFHEATHLLLNPSLDAYVDELSIRTSDPAEKAVDDFAARMLVSESGLKMVETVSLNVQSIVRLARELRIAPGIVVGQLQFRQRIGYGSSLNHLKRHYRWSGVTLEMA